VYGVIWDESGAPVRGATVSVQAADNGAWRADTTTGGSGEYLVSGVPDGTYRVEVSRPGFKLIRRHDVRMARGAAVKIDGILQLGEVAESLTIRADSPAAPKPQVQARAPRARTGGDVRPPRLLRSATPEYPSAAREARIEGVVSLEARLGVDGTVRALKLLGEPTDPTLVEAAMQAVRRWRYEPARLNGEPVEVVLTVTLNFKLS
jgi:TonB family protein